MTNNSPTNNSHYVGVSAVTDQNKQTKGNNANGQYITFDAIQKQQFSTVLRGFEVDFNSLKIQRELGKGNFGVVNLALYEGKEVACKQLKPESGSDSNNVVDSLTKMSNSMQEFVS